MIKRRSNTRCEDQEEEEAEEAEKVGAVTWYTSIAAANQSIVRLIARLLQPTIYCAVLSPKVRFPLSAST
jgi:hypothetical protein